MLADLERRHGARRRLIRFMPWLVVGAIGADAASMVTARSFDYVSALGTLATCGVTVGLAWFIGRRVGRVIDRDLRETVDARRLPTDGEPQ